MFSGALRALGLGVLLEDVAGLAVVVKRAIGREATGGGSGDGVEVTGLRGAEQRERRDGRRTGEYHLRRADSFARHSSRLPPRCQQQAGSLLSIRCEAMAAAEG